MNSGPLVVGTLTACQQATNAKCISKRAGVVPSAAPSASSTPSVSLSPSPTPSVTPTVSESPSPSLFVIVPKGGACDASSTCESGTSCGCFNTCETMVYYEIKGVADDSFEPYVCDNRLIATTTTGPVSTWIYVGPCADLFFVVDNTNGGQTGITAGVRHLGASWLPMVMAGAGVTSTVSINPGVGFMTDPAYDFSGWSTPVQQTTLSANFDYQTFMNEYGSDTISYIDGNTGVTGSTSYYRVELPYC